MKAIWINAAERAVQLVDYAGLQDLQRMVGGHLEVACMWHGIGDVLYVDEEGRLKAPRVWFRMLGLPEVYAGSGVIVGREIGDTARTAPPRLTVAALAPLVRFAVPLEDILRGR